jgi:ABC-2 type transport system ATP-binding protein
MPQRKVAAARHGNSSLRGFSTGMPRLSAFTLRLRARRVHHNASMRPVIDIQGLSKTYASGLAALEGIDLQIRRGEIFALLGPNGAGKTTLISIVCGIVNASAGRVAVDGHDIRREWRAARSAIGLVPQEISTDAFESVWNTVSFSRGLFGKAPNPRLLEGLLKQLSLWDKKDARIMTLSGGMKRRLMIAKALSHEPHVLFLDEPTAGVDVELRRDMWQMVRGLQQRGVTIILTTHYIEEAEQMAERIGVIRKGRILLVQDKARLMQQLGRKRLTLQLQQPLRSLPAELSDWPLALADGGHALVHDFDAALGASKVPELLRRLGALGIDFKDLQTEQSSLEDIFVDLVHR